MHIPESQTCSNVGSIVGVKQNSQPTTQKIHNMSMMQSAPCAQQRKRRTCRPKYKRENLVLNFYLSQLESHVAKKLLAGLGNAETVTAAPYIYLKYKTFVLVCAPAAVVAIAGHTPVAMLAQGNMDGGAHIYISVACAKVN